MTQIERKQGSEGGRLNMRLKLRTTTNMDTTCVG
jgi:hypothetical protein